VKERKQHAALPEVKEHNIMFTKDIGIDLGTANTLVYMNGRGIILREPSVVAVNTHTANTKYIGRAAKEVIGRTPGSIVAVSPLKNGVIADFEKATILLQECIRKALHGKLFTKARVIICTPTDITPLERRAVKEAAEQAGAKRVLIAEAPMAAAIGAGLPTTEPCGCVIVDIGGGTSEVAVISMGGIVSSKSIRCAGKEMDNAIISHLKKKCNLLIGERTAEEIKLEIGSAFPVGNDDGIMEIKGRNILTGLPENIDITAAEIREALNEPLARIVDAVKYTLEQTPPELAADIIEQGITLCGGGALLRGIDRLIAHETGLPVFVSQYPLDCVAEGTGKILADMDRYQDALTEDIVYY
jgi:rod shape-determining protein MreB